MAKHRELASVVYASTLGRASASKIWKTVVFAGAMLAAPAASADDNPCGGATGQYKMKAPEPTKAPVKEVRTADQINVDIADRDTKITAQIQAIVDATTPEARTAAKAELDKLDKERKAFRAELKALKIKPTGPTSGAVVRANLALSTNELKIIRLAGTVATAKTDKDRDAAKLKLAAAQTERTKLDAKLVLAKEEAAKPRPRVQKFERPVGRGFILS